MLISDDGVRHDRGRLSPAVIWTPSEPMPGRLGGTDPYRLDVFDEHFDPTWRESEPYDPDAAFPVMRAGVPDRAATRKALKAAMDREIVAQGERLAAARRTAA